MTVHCIYPSVTNIWIYLYHFRYKYSLVSYSYLYEYIWILIRIIIYLDIRSYRNHTLSVTNICKFSFNLYRYLYWFFVWIYLDIHLSEPFATKLQCLRGGSVLWGGEVLQCNDLCSHPAGCLLLPITSAQDWHPSDQTFVRVAFSTVFFCFCYIWKNAPTPQISWREAPQPSTTLSIWSFQLLQRIFILIHHLQLHLKREEYLEL